MGRVRNVLFIMCDQLRWDYLSCYGHPTLETPHIDALAAKGVRFARAYVQSPMCGPSRMSFYTGRYVFSHGATWNFVPLQIGMPTMGDHLRALGVRTALVGKTHMVADRDGMARLGVSPSSELGVLAGQCGFEPYDRDDGLWPDAMVPADLKYNQYLRAHGYDGDNPWHSWANSVEGPDGAVISGWKWGAAPYPARVAEEHSETAYMTDRAIAFLEEQGEQPFCLHLSYIKPHWPYVAPAPYHDMYGANQCLPVVRSESERAHAHPVHAAFMEHADSVTLQDDDKRRAVVRVYMGLVKQIDDHLGRLFAWMAAAGRMDDTMIVFTSDHGDYLGDHWLGEKDLFHEPSIRVPLIVYDPDTRADATRGSVDDRFAEAIDLAPTFVDALGGDALPHVLEGRSLVPLLRGAAAGWRDAAFCEYDYVFREAGVRLGLGPDDGRAFMIRTDRWKYVLFEAFRPQLFDLENDPDELADLGDSPDHAGIRAELDAALFAWLRRRRTRISMTDDTVRERAGASRRRGFVIGEW